MKILSMPAGSDGKKYFVKNNVVKEAYTGAAVATAQGLHVNGLGSSNGATFTLNLTDYSVITLIFDNATLTGGSKPAIVIGGSTFWGNTGVTSDTLMFDISGITGVQTICACIGQSNGDYYINDFYVS